MAETPTDSLRQTQTPPHAGPHGLELPVAAQRLAWLLARAAAQPRHDVANVRELATAAGLSIRALQYTCARAGATARDCAALVRCLRLVLDGGCWDPVSALSSSDPRTIRRLIHRAALGGERPSVLAFLGRQQLLRQPETRRFLLAELYALDRRLHPNARSLPTTTVVWLQSSFETRNGSQQRRDPSPETHRASLTLQPFINAPAVEHEASRPSLTGCEPHIPHGYRALSLPIGEHRTPALLELIAEPIAALRLFVFGRNADQPCLAR